MKVMHKILPLLLAAILLLSASGGILSAVAVSVGDNAGFGTVKGNTSRKVGEGLTYDATTVTGNKGGDQLLHTLTFNPKTSEFMPIVYSQFSGYGATTLNSAKKAETIGYDVKGGVNASFFSFTGKSANTYGGINICDGKILQGSNSYGANWVLAFNSDGTSQLIQSKVSYSLSAKGGTWTAPVENINICPETTYGGIYYYDTFCGTKTDTKAAGVEIVFEKQDRSELTVGGTLVGKVVEIRKNTSSGGAIGTTQFVLYASDSSQYAAPLRDLAIGDKVTITANETIADSKAVMENCSSALVTYGYHIVKDGANVTASDGLGEDFNTARAQRSSIGVKADGTLVIVASPGRTTDYTGMTVYELADYMISQGCITAINLDGGGSTQMVVENESGDLAAVVAYGRAVANSILIVARPTIDSEMEKDLQALISEADKLVSDSSFTGDINFLKTALTYAKSVASSKQSMPGDYSKAIMRLHNALDVKGSLGDLMTRAASISYADYSEYVLERIRAAYAKADEVYKNEQATKDEVNAAYAELKKWIDLSGNVTINGTKYETVKNGLYLTGFNAKIVDKSSVIYTPGTNIRDMNLTWARVLMLRKDSATGNYLVEKNANGGQSSGVEATVKMLGFDTVPEDCILIVVHGDDGIGKVNKELATAAKIGQKLVLYGIDIETQTIEVGAYFMFVDARKLGDIDGDGKITSYDYAFLKRAYLGTYMLSEEARKVADIDGDGKITSYDYAFLKRAYLGTYKLPE